MPTLDDIRQRKNVQLTDLKERFDATIISEVEKKDSRQKDCLFWEIALVGGGSFTQKLSRGYYGLLEKSMQLMNVTKTEELVGKTMTFEKSSLGVLDSNPRWFPVAYVEPE